MASDHRVAGSSPAGCKPCTRAHLQTIYSSKIDLSKTITCQSLATFEATPRVCVRRTAFSEMIARLDARLRHKIKSIVLSAIETDTL